MRAFSRFIKSLFLLAVILLPSLQAGAQSYSVPSTGPLYQPENMQAPNLDASMPDSSGNTPGEAASGEGATPGSQSPSAASSPKSNPRPDVQPQPKVLYRVPVRARL